MVSIFPGMDPYLEGPVTWAGLHQRLIVSIADSPPAVLLGRSHYDYAVCVSRGDRRGESEVYVSCLQERLPRIAVPLRPPHKDVVLDLTSVFQQCYESGAYRGRVDYSKEPPLPALANEDQFWLQSHLRSLGLRA